MKEFKELGYTIMVNDCIFQQDNPSSFDLVSLVDMIKVDFRSYRTYRQEYIKKSHSVWMLNF